MLETPVPSSVLAFPPAPGSRVSAPCSLPRNKAVAWGCPRALASCGRVGPREFPVPIGCRPPFPAPGSLAAGRGSAGPAPVPVKSTRAPRGGGRALPLQGTRD